jgi:peptidoglycan/LPS O-acetylase OafA/YrhL|tara:strand:- start:122 stop:793 length:672 start_codon:yes stop_codon:yes gene_type:complete
MPTKYCSGPKSWGQIVAYTGVTYIPTILIKGLLLVLIVFLVLCKKRINNTNEQEIIFFAIFILAIVPYAIWNSHSHGENFPLFTTSLKDKKTLGGYILDYYSKNWYKMLILAVLYIGIIILLVKYTNAIINKENEYLWLGLIVLICIGYLGLFIFNSIQEAKDYFKTLPIVEIENMIISIMLFYLFKLSYLHGGNIKTIIIIIIIILSSFANNLYTVLLNQTV